jgi:hypothetical protein
MGSWGVNFYENDDALDWLEEAKEEGSSFILKTLKNILEADYLEAPECVNALAAAEVIATVKGNPVDCLPSDIKEGILESDYSFSKKDAETALKALEKILKDSELKELWEETESFQDWLLSLDDLKKRLAL